MWKFLVALTIFSHAAGVFGLSCVSCGSQPCQTPTCCTSGLYTLDACGCCLTCAKAEDEKCGGPFLISGTCAQGLRCLRKCECKTQLGKECVFPFKFKGNTYTTCTKDSSDNGVAWCATEVDRNGEVVPNTWQDCDSGCPGSDYKCDHTYLFNVDGLCVNSTVASTYLGLSKQGDEKLAVLDDEAGPEQQSAPSCDAARTSLTACRCSSDPVVKGLNGFLKGGCIAPQHAEIDELEYGWCFIENIQDPANPTENCYQDMQWSASDGRWWSYQACKDFRTVNVDKKTETDAGIIFQD